MPPAPSWVLSFRQRRASCRWSTSTRGRLLRRPKRPKRKKDTSGQEAPRPALPFSLTDPLREILKLRLPARTALFCRERLNLSWEAAAQLLGTSPARCQRLYGAALKQAKITAGQARANLETLSGDT
ncbi:MAG: hypothetical protein ACLULM_00420 [Acutalibacter sp.]